MMTYEGMFSIGFSSITTSGILAAFALALGANNMQIGILAAIPFIVQPLQIPAILLVEKLRRRKAIATITWLIAQLIWFPIALIPLYLAVPGGAAVSMLLILMTVRGIISAVTNCGWNSWIRDLVPQPILGRFFSRRLALSTAVAAVFGLAAAFFVEFWNGRASADEAVLGYTYALLFGALVLGLASPYFMSRMPEPLMQKTMGEQPSIFKMIVMPFRDPNFRRLMAFLFSWSFALNMAVPFFAIYMLARLGLPLPTVIGLSVLSQLFNILFLRVWGPLADKFSSKAVLSISASLYLLVILGWTFTTMPERYFLTMPLLVVLHIFAGIAAAGVSLTTGTIGFKLAPQSQSASFMAGVSLAASLGAGLGPLAGGFLGHFFSTRELSLDITWVGPEQILNVGFFNVTGLDFLFVFTFIIGLITLNLLASLREEGEQAKETILHELRSQTHAAMQTVIPNLGPNIPDVLPLSFINRVPGIDIVIGVTAYQLADTAKTVTKAALRGRDATVKVGRALHNRLTKLWKSGVLPPEHDTEIARHAARGAILATEGADQQIESVTKPAISGITSALEKTDVSPYDALRGAAYGVVEGAFESGADIHKTLSEVVNGAKETAQNLRLDEEEATRQVVLGAIEAAHEIDASTEEKVIAELKSIRTE